MAFDTQYCEQSVIDVIIPVTHILTVVIHRHQHCKPGPSSEIQKLTLSLRKN